MTKEQILDVIKLLSALEAWAMTDVDRRRLPDYLLEDVDKAVELLSKEVLK